MSRIQEYIIIEANNGEELTKKINELLSKGWELVGNFQVNAWGYYSQAMIKLKTDIEFKTSKYVD